MSADSSPPDLRTRLIEATMRLLAKTGPSEVKARSVSSEAGLSTMGVYTYFGGVPELLQAVSDEGFTRLATVFQRVPRTDNPLTDLGMMAMGCRDFARRNPHLYDLMFGLSIHGRYRPARGPATSAPGTHTAAFDAAYTLLAGTCARVVAGKRVGKTDPALMAAQLWSAVHGFVMLELADYFADVADPASNILLAMTNNVIIGLGESRARVESASAGIVAKWSSPQDVRPATQRSQGAKKRKGGKS